METELNPDKQSIETAVQLTLARPTHTVNVHSSCFYGVMEGVKNAFSVFRWGGVRKVRLLRNHIDL